MNAEEAHTITITVDQFKISVQMCHIWTMVFLAVTTTITVLDLVVGCLTQRDACACVTIIR